MYRSEEQRIKIDEANSTKRNQDTLSNPNNIAPNNMQFCNQTMLPPNNNKSTLNQQKSIKQIDTKQDPNIQNYNQIDTKQTPNIQKRHIHLETPISINKPAHAYKPANSPNAQNIFENNPIQKSMVNQTSFESCIGTSVRSELQNGLDANSIPFDQCLQHKNTIYHPITRSNFLNNPLSNQTNVNQ